MDFDISVRETRKNEFLITVKEIDAISRCLICNCLVRVSESDFVMIKNKYICHDCVEKIKKSKLRDVFY